MNFIHACFHAESGNFEQNPHRELYNCSTDIIIRLTQQTSQYLSLNQTLIKRWRLGWRRQLSTAADPKLRIQDKQEL